MFKLVALIASISSVLAAPAAFDSLVARAGAPPIQVVHPTLYQNKCMGLVGGTFANGTQVDIFDCNESRSQEWQRFSSGPNNQVTFQTTPDVIQNAFCLDAGNVDELANGVKVKIWKCFAGLAQQQWITLPSGQIALGTGGFCLDLTDGKPDNRNVLQIWECAGPENTNQIWNVTNAV